MKSKLYSGKLMMAMMLMMSMALTVNAQYKTKRIGNKPRTGAASSGFDMVKGHQVAIKMNAGHRLVQLLQLNFDTEIETKDSVGFKVNVYEFNDLAPGENLIKQDIISAIPNGKNKVSVNLEPYNITAKGDILVAIEWLKTTSTNNHFAIGLFNGGTYEFKNDRWKKIPVAGVDFNVLVRKLNRS